MASLRCASVSSRSTLGNDPDEFKEAKLDQYKRENEVQKQVYEATVKYLKDFPGIWNTRNNSLGFIARFGEQKLRAVRDYVERPICKLLPLNT